MNEQIKEIINNDELTDKFINYSDNKDIFNEGLFDEYYKNIKLYISIYLKKIIIAEDPKRKYINSVINIIKIYNCYIIKEINDEPIKIIDNDILKLLLEYKKICFDEINVYKNIELFKFYITKCFYVIEQIDLIIKSINYNDKFVKILHKIDKTISSGNSMNEKEFSILCNLIKNNCYNNLPDQYINHYFKEIYLYGKSVDFETLKESIIQLGKNILKYYNINKTVDFQNIKGDGFSNTNGIVLNIKLIDKYIKTNKKNETVFLTLFHEIRHQIQDKEKKSINNFNYNNLKMIKDFLLVIYMKNSYADINYRKLSIEFDAYNIEQIWFYRYLKSIGINLNSKFLSKINNKINNLIFNTDNRSVGLKQIPVDILFDIHFKEIRKFYFLNFNADILDEYPSLNYIYHRNGKRISTMELLEQRNTLIKEEQSKIDEILNNQILSYKEIREIVVEYRKTKNDQLKKILYKIISNKTKYSFRMILDTYSYICIYCKEIIAKNITRLEDFTKKGKGC